MDRVRKLFKKSDRVKHWQFLTIITMASIVIAPLLATWMFIGGWWAWIWARGALSVLIYAGFGLIYASIGFWIFAVRKLVLTHGTGTYRYMKISMAIIMSAAIISTGFFYGTLTPSTNKPLMALVGPDPSSSTVIVCYTATPQSNLVLEYKLKGSASKSQVFDSGSTTSHRFLLNNLQWNSTYVYRLIVNTTSTQEVPMDLSQTLEFKTTPRNSTDGFKFLSISDIHSAMPSLLQDQMAQTPSDVIVQAGDLADYGSMNAEWDGYFSSTRKLYTRTGMDDPAPLHLPAIGNHDSFWFGKSNFGLFFGGVGNGSNSPYYYRIDIGDIHFIVLDLEWGLESFSAEQETWLNQTLASINSGGWIFVVTHSEFYSSGDFGTQPDVVAKLTPIFQNGHVDLVISGHEHHYERLIAGGITYIITGTGGPKPDSSKGLGIAESESYIASQHIFGSYTISGSSLDFKAYYANGTVADSATILNT